MSMLCIPHAIDLDTEYIMQIIGVKFERKPFQHGRDTFTFTVRVWPYRNKPSQYVEVKERFYDGGTAEKYLISFIENATDGAYGIITADEMIGAAFKGIITVNTKGYVKHYNLKALSPLGYAEIDLCKTADEDERP